MSASILKPPWCENRLLNALTAAQYHVLQPCLERVHIQDRQALHEEHKSFEYVYFPCTAVLSVVVFLYDSNAVEIATIGNEGFSGVALLLGEEVPLTTTLAQTEGECIRMRISDFKKAIAGNTTLRSITQQYAQAYLNVLSQTVACNCVHGIEQRFSGSLLIAQNKAGSDHFHLPQIFLSKMLGVRPYVVKRLADSFERIGLIAYDDDKITILNRQALEEISCECHEAINALLNRPAIQGIRQSGDRRRGGLAQAVVHDRRNMLDRRSHEDRRYF